MCQDCNLNAYRLLGRSCPTSSREPVIDLRVLISRHVPSVVRLRETATYAAACRTDCQRSTAVRGFTTRIGSSLGASGTGPVGVIPRTAE